MVDDLMQVHIHQFKQNIKIYSQNHQFTLEEPKIPTSIFEIDAKGSG